MNAARAHAAFVGRQRGGLLPAAVAADPDVALVIDVDAVIRRRPVVALGPDRPNARSGRPPALNSRTGGAAAQHSRLRAASSSAYCSFASSEPARWMIQTLSLPSTATPMVAPITQWFGSGFGHIGSTSNRGPERLRPQPCARSA